MTWQTILQKYFPRGTDLVATVSSSPLHAFVSTSGHICDPSVRQGHFASTCSSQWLPRMFYHSWSRLGLNFLSNLRGFPIWSFLLYTPLQHYGRPPLSHKFRHCFSIFLERNSFLCFSKSQQCWLLLFLRSWTGQWRKGANGELFSPSKNPLRLWQVCYSSYQLCNCNAR